MTLTRLRQILAAYGANPARWPTLERATAEVLLDKSDDPVIAAEQKLDAALDTWTVPAVNHALAYRIRTLATTTPQCEPTQSMSWFPGLLLPVRVWLHAASLACALMIGVMVGLSDLTEFTLVDGSEMGSDLLDSIYWETWS